MLSAVSSSWDSTLVAPASSLSPAFATSEVPAFGDDLVISDEGLQFVASFLQQSGHAGPPQLDVLSAVETSPLDDQLPSIDESLFDLVEVPDLEDVTNDDLNSTNVTGAVHLNCNQLFDEIPALEDVPDDEVHWPSWASEEVAITSETTVAPQPVSPPNGVPSKEHLTISTTTNNNANVVALPLTTGSPSAAIKSVLLEDNEDITVYEEEVKSTELPGYLEVGLASPASVYSAAGSTTSGVSGDASPARLLTPVFSTFSDDLPTNCYSTDLKRRRVSQVSVASSFYSSMGSPASSSSSGLASDSDHSEGPRRAKAGRRSRFSPEDRKERKKAQNRTAAERYRQKRRQAEEIISEEEQQFLDANGALRIEVTKLEAEVSCMKRLMREMLRANGIEIPAAPPSAKKAKTINN